jgi:hypothetical protein
VWQEAVDEVSGMTYYYNVVTRLSSWERPVALDQATGSTAVLAGAGGKSSAVLHAGLASPMSAGALAAGRRSTRTVVSISSYDVCSVHSPSVSTALVPLTPTVVELPQPAAAATLL